MRPRWFSGQKESNDDRRYRRLTGGEGVAAAALFCSKRRKREVSPLGGGPFIGVASWRGGGDPC
jgi:hypothetical protein